MREDRQRPEPDPAPPRRARRAGALFLTAMLAASGGLLWWWVASHRVAPPLGPGWNARVVVLAGSGTPGMRDGDPFEAQFSDPFHLRNTTLLIQDVWGAHPTIARRLSGNIGLPSGREWQQD